MKKKEILIFISDEGFGHAVRQRALIKSLLKKNKSVSIKVITSKKIILLKETFKNRISYFHHHNLIETIKNDDGSINKVKTKKMFLNWYKKKKFWVKIMKEKFPKPNFIVSDSVPQAFDLAKELNVKSINISHFTWDWFYKKHFLEKKKKDSVLKELMNSYNLAKKFLILPLTPSEIIKNFEKKCININLIISDFKIIKKKRYKNFVCVIMDNGTNTLSKLIKESVPYLNEIKNVDFYVGIKDYDNKIKKHISLSKNIYPIHGLKKIHHTIPYADFVIARAGFNTITETLVLNKPSIFFNETKNEETSHNIKMLQKFGIASIIKKNEFKKKIVKKINYFIKNDYKILRQKIINAKFLSNGSENASNFILKELK